MFFIRQVIYSIKKIRRRFFFKRTNLFLLFILPISLLGILYIFSFSISSQYLGSLAKLDNQGDNNQLIIEKTLPTIPQTKESDFTSAAFREKDSELPLTLGGSTLISPDIKIKEMTPQTRTGIQEYTVQEGDTISGIAEKFGLKWSTILWANDLHYWSIIKPGQKLKILPVDGLLHKVKKGENLSYIAKKYKSSVEDISEINSLDEYFNIKPGEILIIPNGILPPPPKPAYVYKKAKTVFVQENYSGYWSWRSHTQCHRFIAQQCTDWAAYQWATKQGQCVPSWGNAKDWYGKASANSLYQVGSTPKKGAIMYLTCTSWLCSRYGHVAYVESFSKNTVTISEMNGLRHHAYSKRTLKNITRQWQNSWKIMGYIYPR